MSPSASSNRTREGYAYDDWGSLTAATDNPAAPYSAVIASHKSVVKVAIPHCRGRWFPTTATRSGREWLGITDRDNTGFFSNIGGRASHRIRLFGLKLMGRTGADIAGSLTVGSVWNGTKCRAKQAPGGYTGTSGCWDS